MDNFAIITGCDSGIGKSTAEYLAKNGWNIFACVYKENEKTKIWASNLFKETKKKIYINEIDLRSTISIKSAIKQIKSKKVHISSLVNVAGITIDATVQMSRRDDIREVMEVNMLGQVEFSQYALKTFSKTGHRSIVFVSSTAAFSGGFGQLAYASSKAAIANATKTFSRELGPLGINVNAVAPGVINTNMNSVIDAKLLNTRIERTSLKRMGEALEVAKVIGFLLSKEAGHISSQVIKVDGGLL